MEPPPVKSLEEQFHHILINGGTNNDYTAVVYKYGGKGGIHPLHISKTAKVSVHAIGLENQVIIKHIVDTHYL